VAIKRTDGHGNSNSFGSLSFLSHNVQGENMAMDKKAFGTMMAGCCSLVFLSSCFNAHNMLQDNLLMSLHYGWD
jgi:hypothetical protein